MNSFFVPQLGSQIYTMAGMITRLHLQADHAGSYRGMSAQFSGEGFADMHFNVDAVAPEKFSDWVDATRNVGPEFNVTTYAELVKPSAKVPPFTYRAVAPGLFDSILVSEMQSDDAMCRSYPTSHEGGKMNLLGKLDWSAIPFDQPIIMGASGGWSWSSCRILSWVTAQGLRGLICGGSGSPPSTTNASASCTSCWR